MKKKMFKRAGVAVLSMAMLLSMGAVGAISASAAATLKVGSYDTYTAGNTTATAQNSQTVNVYKVATRSNTGVWSWVSGDYVTFNDSTNAEKHAYFVSPATDDPKKVLVGDLSGQNLNLLAQALAADTTNFKTATNNIGTGTNNNAAITLTDVGVAYCLVETTPTAAGELIQPTLVEIDTSATAETSITPKVSDLPIDKTIEAVETGKGEKATDGNSGVAQVGAVVTYKIATKLPSYADGTGTPASPMVTGDMIQNFVITDEPTAGVLIGTDYTNAGADVEVFIDGEKVYDNNAVVTGTAGTVTLDGSTAQGSSGTYNVEVDNVASTDKFTVTIPGQIVWAHQGEDVYVTFKATVQAAALKGNQANNNTGKISYGNNWSTGGGTKEKQDTVPLYVGKIELNKKDSRNTDKTGATFTLSGPVNKTLDMTSLSTIDFGYLPAGNYTLTETIAPHGCKAMVGSWTFTVETKTNTSGPFDKYTVTTTGTKPTELTLTDNDTVNHGDYTVTVVNPDADSLPGTGGMGTVMFTVGGAAIVLCAGFMFVIYMRKRRAEEE